MQCVFLLFSKELITKESIDSIFNWYSTMGVISRGWPAGRTRTGLYLDSCGPRAKTFFSPLYYMNELLFTWLFELSRSRGTKWVETTFEPSCRCDCIMGPQGSQIKVQFLFSVFNNSTNQKGNVVDFLFQHPPASSASGILMRKNPIFVKLSQLSSTW